MASLLLTVQDIIGGYPVTPLTAEAADFVWTTAGADFADGAHFPHTGKEIILVRNDNVGAQTVTINSSVTAENRLGNITTYSVGIGEYVMFGPFPVHGWRQTTGFMTIAASATDVFFAIIRIV